MLASSSDRVFAFTAYSACIRIQIRQQFTFFSASLCSGSPGLSRRGRPNRAAYASVSHIRRISCSHPETARLLGPLCFHFIYSAIIRGLSCFILLPWYATEMLGIYGHIAYSRRTPLPIGCVAHAEHRPVMLLMITFGDPAPIFLEI
jgi:hypothetical protein